MLPHPSTASRAWLVGVTAAVLVAGAYLASGAPRADLDPEGQVSSLDQPDRQINVSVQARPCPQGYENSALDGVCLAYDGQIPGPTFVFEQGERVELTVEHDVASTLDELNLSALKVDDRKQDELVESRYTLHRHGVSTENCEDGVAKPMGTEVCDSTIPPGESVTYEFTARFPGFWHYHDHSLGLGEGTPHGEAAGPMAEERGLWGAFRVLEEGASTDHVFDLHLLDTGPNGGLGLDRTVQAGERFDLIVTGLGDIAWTVSLSGPDDETLWTQDLGPGVSRGYTVDSAETGSYEWTAQSPSLPGRTFSGEVTVE